MEKRQFHTAALNMCVAFRRSVCIVAGRVRGQPARGGQQGEGTILGKGRALYIERVAAAGGAHPHVHCTAAWWFSFLAGVARREWPRPAWHASTWKSHALHFTCVTHAMRPRPESTLQGRGNGLWGEGSGLQLRPRPGERPFCRAREGRMRAASRPHCGQDRTCGQGRRSPGRAAPCGNLAFSSFPSGDRAGKWALRGWGRRRRGYLRAGEG